MRCNSKVATGTYLTLVYQIDTHCKRLLWIGSKRKIKTGLDFSSGFGLKGGDQGNGANHTQA